MSSDRAVYPLCVGLTALQSIAAALPLGAVSAAANALPLGSMGFGWVLPAAGRDLQPGCFQTYLDPAINNRPKGAGAHVTGAPGLCRLLQLFAFFVVVQGGQCLLRHGHQAPSC